MYRIGIVIIAGAIAVAAVAGKVLRSDAPPTVAVAQVPAPMPTPAGADAGAVTGTQAPTVPAATPVAHDERAAVPAIDAAAAARAATFVSRDGTATFQVPQPTDAEWADYREMLNHPAYRSSGTSSPGFAMPYDPEWRAVARGRRDAPAVDLALENAVPHLEDLAQAVLESLRDRDAERLLSLHLTRDEFLRICWREFPQSRPYLKIPDAEAWSFQQSKCSEAALSALRAFGGRGWILHSVESGRSTPYRNFTLHEGVTIRAIDPESGRLTVLGVAPVVVERDGRFKVFVYGE
jgi:hypothetical protein